MFCPKCGTYNDKCNSFCYKCSYDFANIPDNIKNVEYSYSRQNDTECDREITLDRVNSKLKKKKKNSLDYCKDYFILSVLSSVFCSALFGAAAIIFSGMSQTEKAVGNRKKARLYSEKARMLCLLAVAVGITKFLFVVALILCMYLA